MGIRVLAVGDVAGEAGVDFLCRRLPALRREHDIHFTVVCGENSAFHGLLPAQADAIFAAGADVITMGNHTWGKRQIVKYMEGCPYLLRPANYPDQAPGRGWGVFDGPRGLRLRVVDLIGRVGMDPNFDSPFTKMDQILKEGGADLTLVDFHAEATSEKGAMAWYLDGRVQALWGTRPEQAINLFLGGMPQRFEPAPGPCKLNAVLFRIDAAAKRCVGVERVDL